MSKQKNNEVLKYNEPAFAGAGDYWIPLIKLQPVEEKRLNKYGRMRRVFLQEQKPIIFDDLVLTEQLFPHLYEVQEIVEKSMEVIMTGLLEKNPAPDKEADAMAWVRHMNLLKAMAEACVLLTQKRNEKDYEFEIEVSLMIDSDRLFEDSRPTYTNIRKYVFDKYGIKLQLKDIADVKRDYGMKMKVNKHLIKGDEPVRRKCTPNKRKYIIEALKYYHVI